MKTNVMRMLAAAVMAAWVPAMTGRAQVNSSVQHVLDLTNSNVVKTMPIVNESSGAGRSGQAPPAPLPLGLRIAAVDRDASVIGTPITYDVEIANVGDKPFGLPWSADLQLIKPPGRSFIESTLFLEVSDRAGNEYHLGTVILGGATSVRDSIEMIRPGETALIRAVSSVNPPPDAQIGGVPSLVVRAIYRLSTSPFNDWQDLRSINALPISFRPPQ